MKKGSTYFLRGVIYVIGIFVLVLCVYALPRAIMAELRGDFDYGVIFVGMYAPAVPFFIALHRALKLLGNIDSNEAFSESSIKALRYIRNCAVAISGMFALGMPYIFYVADRDDAPGVVALALVIIFASSVFATFAAVLQKLVQNAVEIKKENELTV